jgi:hypothetical protein
MIKRGNYYTYFNSSLVVEVLNIIELTNYAKVKLAIYSKSGRLQEAPKYYKLTSDRYSHWLRCDESGKALV